MSSEGEIIRSHFNLFGNVKVNGVKGCSITWNLLEDIGVNLRVASSTPGASDLEYRVSDIIDIDYRKAAKLKVLIAFAPFSAAVARLPGPIPHGIQPNGLRVLKLKFKKADDFNQAIENLFGAKVFTIQMTTAIWYSNKKILKLLEHKKYHKLQDLPLVTRRCEFERSHLKGWKDQKYFH